MKNEQVKKTMKGALILSIASLIAKILSAVYRIPFENIVGNTGFYVYQQVYPIYGIGVAFALTGFPVYISKLVAEQRDEATKLRLVQQIFLILCVFSGAIFVGLRVFAPFIALLMGDPPAGSFDQKCGLDVFVHANFGSRARILSRNV